MIDALSSRGEVGRGFDDQVLVVGSDRGGEQRVGFFVIGDDAVRRAEMDLLDHGFGELLFEIAAKDVGLEEDGDGLDFGGIERSVEMPAEETVVLAELTVGVSHESAAAREDWPSIDGEDQASRATGTGNRCAGALLWQ